MSSTKTVLVSCCSFKWNTKMKLFLKSGLNTENKQFRDSHCKRFLGCCVLCTRYGYSWCTSDGPFYRDVCGTEHSDVLMEADQHVLSVPRRSSASLASFCTAWGFWSLCCMWSSTNCCPSDARNSRRNFCLCLFSLGWFSIHMTRAAMHDTSTVLKYNVIGHLLILRRREYVVASLSMPSTPPLHAL